MQFSEAQRIFYNLAKRQYKPIEKLGKPQKTAHKPCDTSDQTQKEEEKASKCNVHIAAKAPNKQTELKKFFQRVLFTLINTKTLA